MVGLSLECLKLKMRFGVWFGIWLGICMLYSIDDINEFMVNIVETKAFTGGYRMGYTCPEVQLYTLSTMTCSHYGVH